MLFPWGHFPGKVAFFFRTMLDLVELEGRLEGFLAQNSCSLAHFQAVSSGRGRIFRLFVERADGSPADLNDCVRLAPLVKLFLESQQAFNDDCTLEISSPGLDRVLKHERDFERFAGRQVSVSVRSEGKKLSFTGELRGRRDEKLVVKAEKVPGLLEEHPEVASEDGEVVVPLRLVTQIRLTLGETL